MRGYFTVLLIYICFCTVHYYLCNSNIYIYEFNTTDVTCEAGTANPSRAPEFIPCFSMVWLNSFLCNVLFIVYISLFVLLSWFVLALYCLSFFDLWLLITPLVSSSSSSYQTYHRFIPPFI
jgi:hypothetical protein